MDAYQLVFTVIALIIGLLLLLWSADRFVAGAAASARHFGMSPLLIGMLIVGFGTSAPEMVVSILASIEGNPGLALGNAYGSNITNIALILGITALIRPLGVASRIIHLELPILLGVTGLTGILLYTGTLSMMDGILLLFVFSVLMVWSLWQSRRNQDDHLGDEVLGAMGMERLSIGKALWWTVIGLIVLVISSRIIVWGAVRIASMLGVEDLVIGLTVIALGTSLPELASSIAAVRKNEHDIAFGNILGSNLFNTLVVVGLAASISPLTVPEGLLVRDYPVMAAMTVVLFIFAFGFHKIKRINRLEGLILFLGFIAYTTYLILSVT